MAWSAPATWATGQVLAFTDMNTYVRDNTLHLYDIIHGNVTENLTIDGTLTLTSNLFQGGAYGYLGSFNSTTYPRAGTDVGIGYNFSAGGREITLWNTDTAGTTPFAFRQLTGASSSVEALRVTTTQTLHPNGSVSIPSIAGISDTNTGLNWNSADVATLVAGGQEIMRFAIGAAVPHLSFFNGGTVAKQTVTGSRGGNAALATLLTALSNYGLLTDSSTA